MATPYSLAEDLNILQTILHVVPINGYKVFWKIIRITQKYEDVFPRDRYLVDAWTNTSIDVVITIYHIKG